MNLNNPADWLQMEFELRKNKNPRYSLRSFARALDIPPGRLSEYFSGKRSISHEAARKIGRRLHWKERDRESFERLVVGSVPSTEIRRVCLDETEFLSNSLNFSLLCLLGTPGVQADKKWLAKRLKVSVHDLNQAMGCLIRLGFIVEGKEGWRVVHERIRTTTDIPSFALRKSQTETLLRAMESLEKDPVHLREISTSTLKCSLEDMEWVKREIHKFRRKISKRLESHEECDQVFELNVQFVPVTEIKEKGGGK